MELATHPATAVRGHVSERVVWHDLECGGYRADLPLWLGLAGQAENADTATQAGGERHGRILDVGAGSGRVSLELARAGHRVTALDLDPELLVALDQRAAALQPAGSAGPLLETVCADARTFALTPRDFSLCIVPMQTIQLLGGRSRRIEFLRRARTHLRRGAPLACAIVTDVEPFDCRSGDSGPSAESVCFEHRRFTSRAVGVRVTREHIRIERERSVEDVRGRAGATSERDVIELDRVSAAQLRRDGRAAGLSAGDTLAIDATDDHVGSLVVVLGA